MNNEQSILRNGEWLMFLHHDRAIAESVPVIDECTLYDLEDEIIDLFKGFGFSDYIGIYEWADNFKDEKSSDGIVYEIIFENKTEFGDNTIECIHEAFEMIAPELHVDVNVRLVRDNKPGSDGTFRIGFEIEFFNCC